MVVRALTLFPVLATVKIPNLPLRTSAPQTRYELRNLTFVEAPVGRQVSIIIAQRQERTPFVKPGLQHDAHGPAARILQPAADTLAARQKDIVLPPRMVARHQRRIPPRSGRDPFLGCTPDAARKERFDFPRDNFFRYAMKPPSTKGSPPADGRGHRAMIESRKEKRQEWGKPRGRGRLLPERPLHPLRAEAHLRLHATD